MKFLIVLAATAYGALVDCGDQAVAVLQCEDTTDYCTAGSLCATLVADGDACDANGDCASTICDTTCRIADAGTCAANGDCIAASYCASTVCTTLLTAGDTCAATTDCAEGYCNATPVCAALVAAGSACAADADCATPNTNTCVANCGSSVCGTNTNDDGALGGCCATGTAVASTDNYCTADADGIVTVKKDDAAVCDTGNAGWCKSGGCTDDGTGGTSGTCDATDTGPAAGELGGSCKAAVIVVAAVAACDQAGDPLADVACFGDDANATPPVVGTCADADGVACVTAVDAVIEVVAVACATDGDTCTAGVCSTPATTLAPAADSPAAIFYGMSMVTAAVAYLL